MHKILSYWWEALKYASMSICAIYAGYVIQAKQLKTPISADLGILIIPALASVGFFMCYAKRFDPKRRKNASAEFESDSEWWKAALFTFLVVAILLTVIVYLITQALSIWLIAAFLTQAAMYAYYAHYLINRLGENSNRVLRHQLFWPVILSIGFSLYYGIAFSDLSASWLPLIPVAGITILYIMDRLSALERKVFVRWMAVLFFILTVLVILANTSVLFFPQGLAENANSMLICVAISIYLAVFEAWVVTSQVTDLTIAQTASEETRTKVELVDQKPFQYSAATLSFLILIIWIFPILFILSPYGGYFLIGFGIHALSSFLIWSALGRGKYLRSLPWRYLKTGAVLTFLSFLVSTKVFDEPPIGRFYVNLVDLTPVFGFGVITIFSVRQLLTENYRRRTMPLQILTERINFARILSLVSFITYVGLYLTLTFLTSNKESVRYYKAEMVLCFYGICIVLCALVVMWNNNLRNLIKPLLKRSMKAVLRVLAGVLIVSRVVPSALLGLAVALPSFFCGFGIRQSILSALPFFLSAVGAFALNDYYDVEKDKINKPYRAIPSGKLSARFVLLYGIAFIGNGLLCALLLSRTSTELILYLLCISGMTAYNLFVKHLSMSKTFLTAAVSALPLLFSVLVFDYAPVFILLPVAACSFILGREWLMDIRDVKGDSKDQSVTLPMIIGPSATTQLGFAMQLVAGVLLVPIALSNFSYWSLTLVVMIFSSTIFLYFLWSKSSGRFEQTVIRLLWIPMFWGLLFFVK